MVLLACIFMLRAVAMGYGSQSKLWQVANALLQHRIVLDAILIGEGQENSDVMALVKATNGYAFCARIHVRGAGAVRARDAALIR